MLKKLLKQQAKYLYWFLVYVELRTKKFNVNRRNHLQ